MKTALWLAGWFIRRRWEASDCGKEDGGDRWGEVTGASCVLLKVQPCSVLWEGEG